MADTHIRNFKDFLLLYNQISETCFKRCANTFMSREVTADEDQCVQNCTQKYIHANHKIMQIYVEVQPILVEKRIKEINKAQAALENQEKAQPELETPSQPETPAQPEIQSPNQISIEKEQLQQNIAQAVQ